MYAYFETHNSLVNRDFIIIPFRIILQLKLKETKFPNVSPIGYTCNAYKNTADVELGKRSFSDL